MNTPLNIKTKEEKTDLFKEMWGELSNMTLKEVFDNLTLKRELNNKFTFLGKIFLYPLAILGFNLFFWSLFIMGGFMSLFEYIFKIPAEMLTPIVKRLEKLFIK